MHDKQTGSDIVLSDDQVELVNRLQRGQFGDVNFNEYEVCSHRVTPGFCSLASHLPARSTL